MQFRFSIKFLDFTPAMLIVIGGWDGKQNYNTTDLYTVGGGEIVWSGQSTAAPFSGGWLRAGAVEHNRRIYVAGGWAYATSSTGSLRLFHIKKYRWGQQENLIGIYNVRSKNLDHNYKMREGGSQKNYRMWEGVLKKKKIKEGV